MRNENEEKAEKDKIRTASNFNHAEAYCLMIYSGVVGTRFIHERVWNSRDGVTPFIIFANEGKMELKHTHWDRDFCCPLHVPLIGERVFVDLTPERAKEIAAKQVERDWDVDCGGYQMSQTFESREAAIESLTASHLGPKGPNGEYGVPDVIVVDEAWQQKFIERRLSALVHLDRYIRIDERLKHGG